MLLWSLVPQETASQSNIVNDLDTSSDDEWHGKHETWWVELNEVSGHTHSNTQTDWTGNVGDAIGGASLLTTNDKRNVCLTGGHVHLGNTESSQN